MKITDVRVLELRVANVDDINDSSQDAAIVIVDTDEGISGLGEADSSPSVVKAVIDAPRSHHMALGIREALLGRDALDVAGCWQRMYEATIFFGRVGAAMHAISGVELALWDIAGKTAGRPVYDLLGGTPRPVRAYASILAPAPADAAAAVAPIVDAGFGAIKIGWGAFREGFEAGRRGHEVEIVRAVRDQVPAHVELMVDVGFYWSVEEGIAASTQLADLGVMWIEEPFDPGDLASYRGLSAGSAIDVAGGENESDFAGFERLVRYGGVRVLQPDVSRCGGLSVARRVAALARDCAIRCVPHVWSTGINAAVAVHLAIADGLDLVEYSLAETALNRDLVRGGPRLVDGYLHSTPAPGFGVSLDPAIVDELRL